MSYSLAAIVRFKKRPKQEDANIEMVQRLLGEKAICEMRMTSGQVSLCKTQCNLTLGLRRGRGSGAHTYATWYLALKGQKDGLQHCPESEDMLLGKGQQHSEIRIRTSYKFSCSVHLTLLVTHTKDRLDKSSLSARHGYISRFDEGQVVH